ALQAERTPPEVARDEEGEEAGGDGPAGGEGAAEAERDQESGGAEDEEGEREGDQEAVDQRGVALRGPHAAGEAGGLAEEDEPGAVGVAAEEDPAGDRQ